MSTENRTVPAEDMALINRLTRRELSEEEVYTFPVVLCDNETDRDGERFSVEALEKLAELFVGKTGIFDHDPRGRNQTARVYAAEVVRDTDRVTKCGEPYTCVRAKAYMMRTDGNADFIREIDGGIKKEVSVSCAASKKHCGICGADMRVSPCSHVKGCYYGGKLADVVLDGITDAYEWSFVAVPAQPAAGITKALGSPDGFGAERKALMREIESSRAEITRLKHDTTAEIIRLGQFCVPAYDPEWVGTVCKCMTVDELLRFKEKTRAKAVPGYVGSILYHDKPSDRHSDQARFKLNASGRK